MFKKNFFNGHVLPYLVDLEHKVWLHERWAVSWRLTLHFSIWYLESCCVLQCSGDLEDKVWLHEHGTVPLWLTSWSSISAFSILNRVVYCSALVTKRTRSGSISMGLYLYGWVLVQAFQHLVSRIVLCIAVLWWPRGQGLAPWALDCTFTVDFFFSSISAFAFFYFFFTFHILQLYCPNGIFFMGNSGCFPRGKPAATESRYPTYSACWVF